VTATTDRPAARYVWVGADRHHPLADGALMTAREALVYVEANWVSETTDHTIQSETRISFRSRLTARRARVYTGEHPKIAALVADAGMAGGYTLTVQQTALLAAALRARLDGADPGQALDALLDEHVQAGGGR
jgi:hypothetical protein